MNGQKVIAAEFVVSFSILTWAAAKQGFWPWPASLARAAFGFAVLSLVGLWNEQIAALLGAGFLLAQVLKMPVDADGNFKFTGGIPDPKDVAYPLLDITPKKDQQSKQQWTPGGAKLPTLKPSSNSGQSNSGGVVSA